MVEPTCTGPFRIGDDIIGYKVLGLLGSGGQAFVYESRDPFLGHAVAIKVIQRPPGGSDPMRRGRAEAKILTELQHPNVVRVHLARLLSPTMICIVMEKLDGLSLRHLLRLYKRLSITETLRIVRQIADALSAAHKMNVIHRDIKPENVFVLPPDNRVKVLDFGIAKLTGLGLTTNKFRFHGTPIYMAPEQLREGTASVRSDVFQLVLNAFEMMTGTHPYVASSDWGNIELVILRQIQQPTPLLSSFVPDASPSMDYLIQKGTAKDPNQRHQSMEELIFDIDKALTERESTHPNEAKHVRYLDAAMILAAQTLDSERVPWANDAPVERADAKAAALNPLSATRVAPDPLATVHSSSRRSPSTPAPAAPRPRSLPKGQPPASKSQSLASNSQSPASNSQSPASNSQSPASIRAVTVWREPRHGRLATVSNRARVQGVTPTLLLSGVLIGGLLGLASSWSSLQRAYEDRKTEEPTPAGSVVIVGEPVPPAQVRTTDAHTLRPNPPMRATSSATAKEAVATRISVTATPKPKRAKPKTTSPDTELPLIPASSSRATKEEIARMRARVREFNADLEQQAREKQAREATQ